MSRNHSIAIMLGTALLWPVLGVAQSVPGEQQSEQPSAAAVVPEADRPTTEQLNKLFQAMRIREQMQSYVNTLPAATQQIIKEQGDAFAAQTPADKPLTPEQKEQIQRVISKFTEKALTLYPQDEMIADMRSIYRRHLTREDVNAYIAFYSTPAGQHLLDLAPLVMKEYVPLVIKRTQERSRVLTAEMMKELEQTTGGSLGPTLIAPPPPPLAPSKTN